MSLDESANAAGPSALGVGFALLRPGRAGGRPAEGGHIGLRIAALASVLGLVGWVLVQGWLADDAAVTARSVDNLLHGYGLRWNADERVQGFTHPLWALLLILAMAMQLPWHLALLGLGIATTALFLSGMARFARSGLAALCGCAALAGSHAFVDYATSGLENPLANLLMVLLVALAPRTGASARDVRNISLVTALVVLTRHDLALLALPVLASTCLMAVRAGVPIVRVALACALGQLPLVAWHAFSLVYFGFALPNTAYAKLNTGIDARTYAALGLRYYLDALARDTWTLLAIPAFLAHAVRYRASTLPIAVALGVCAYLAYIASIGDFMAGRFFVAPLACSVVVAVSRHVESVGASDMRLFAGTVVMASLGLLRPLQPVLGDKVVGIVDERSRNPSTAIRALFARGGAGPDNSWVRLGTTWRNQAAKAGADVEGGRVLVRHAHAVGMVGLAAGPHVHVIDHHALTDPFLARLPAAYDPEVQAGHFERMGQWSSPIAITQRCPLKYEVCRFWRDYTKTLETQHCQLEDANACRYWDALRTVTRGGLWSLERWRNIWLFNTGQLDHWIDRPRYRDAVRIYPGLN